MISFLYAESAGFCAILLFLILLRTNSIIEFSYSGKIFRYLIIISCIFCIIDCLWGVAGVFTNAFVFTLLSYLFHLSSSFIALVWFNFSLKYLGKKYYQLLPLRIIPFCLLAFEFAIIILNFFTNKLFFIDENCVYHTSPLRFVLFTSQFLNYLCILILAIYCLFNEKDEERKIYPGNTIIFSLISLLTGILQFILPDSPVYSLGFTTSVFIIFAYIITHENNVLMLSYQNQKNQEEYQKKLKRDISVLSAISGKYEMVLFVDDSDNIINFLNVTDRVRKYLPEEREVVTGTEFDEILKKTVMPENLESFVKSVNREKITKACLNGQRVSIDYTAIIDDKKTQCRIYFAIDKENNNNVLIAIRNIDEEFYMKQELEDQRKVISNLEMQNKMAFEIASMDGLTGLINKISFIERVERYLVDNSSENCALIFFDMDHFKKINDLFGHNTGDDALREMAKKLKSLFRSDELIARMGGDEFCIFLPLISLNLVKQRIEQMNKTLVAEYCDDDNKIKTSASIGCAYCESKNITYVEMHSVADKAMYEVKRKGRNGSVIKIV